MGGSLSATSTRGQGTTFIVELQTAEGHTALDEAALSAGGGSRRCARDVKGTVLYIEDNVSNLRLFERIVARRPGRDAAIGDARQPRARAGA